VLGTTLSETAATSAPDSASARPVFFINPNVISYSFLQPVTRGCDRILNTRTTDVPDHSKKRYDIVPFIRGLVCINHGDIEAALRSSAAKIL
jgi:hypothetical protein